MTYRAHRDYGPVLLGQSWAARCRAAWRWSAERERVVGIEVDLWSGGLDLECDWLCVMVCDCEGAFDDDGEWPLRRVRWEINHKTGRTVEAESIAGRKGNGHFGRDENTRGACVYTCRNAVCALPLPAF
jgi:hypothetical protein